MDHRGFRAWWGPAVAAAIALLAGGVAGCAGDRELRRLRREAPDIVLVGGVVHTMDPDQPAAEAVAVVGDRISYVGDRAGIEGRVDDHTRVIELDGQAVVPGMMDTQIHLVELGRRAEIVDLTGTTSREEIRSRMAYACAGAEPGRWIHGTGWDQNDWVDPRFPTAADLDVCESNPVYLNRIGRHVYWVNREALVRAGVNRATPDPPGGRVGRLEDGEPSGLFFDDAMKLVDRVVPGQSAEDLERWIPAAARECMRLGLTSIGDSGTTQKRLRAYEQLAQRGELRVRVYVMIEDDPAEVAAVTAEGPRIGEYDHFLTVRTIKENVDGTMGSRGAALLEPYADDPENVGTLLIQREELVDVAIRALERGFQMDTHAIGDRATRLTLDAYEEALRKKPVKDHRFRIEHAQLLHPDDVPRFAALGVIPMMQPTQATSDMPWVEQRLGADRLALAYAWRSLIDSGAHVGFGSDYPVESANPLWGIHAAVTRQDHDGHPAGGWVPAQRITAEEALRAYTAETAYACFEEDLRGSLTPGKLADVVVVDRDILAVPPRELLEAQVVLTMVGGTIAYEAAP